jgi:phytoene synthase
MSVEACADLLRKGDPDRFLSAMTAPVNKRAGLLVLYAFNIEIARAPWVTAEPMIAQMRLQFWTDVIEDAIAGKAAHAHEVAAPLADLIQAQDRAGDILSQMVNARQFDIYRDPHADDQALRVYLDQTAGHLMWLAALMCGAKPSAEPTVRNFAFGTGLAALFRATPALISAGRKPLTDDGLPAIGALAKTGLAAMAKARTGSIGRNAAPARRAGWMAQPILARAQRDPSAVLEGRLEPSEFSRRSRLLLKTMTGRW